jgi:hypothetical protein
VNWLKVRRLCLVIPGEADPGDVTGHGDRPEGCTCAGVVRYRLGAWTRSDRSLEADPSARKRVCDYSGM